MTLPTVLQILENTPQNHVDHSSLKLALERAEELCSQVNEGVREKENSDRLEWIQAHVQCEGLAEVRLCGELDAPGRFRGGKLCHTRARSLTMRAYHPACSTPWVCCPALPREAKWGLPCEFFEFTGRNP